MSRSLFKVVAVSGDSARLDSNGFQFDTPRQQEGLLLEPGQILSAEIKSGTETALENIFIENAAIDFERKEFESAGLDAVGWTPYNNPPKPAGKE